MCPEGHWAVHSKTVKIVIIYVYFTTINKPEKKKKTRTQRNQTHEHQSQSQACPWHILHKGPNQEFPQHPSMWMKHQLEDHITMRGNQLRPMNCVQGLSSSNVEGECPVLFISNLKIGQTHLHLCKIRKGFPREEEDCEGAPGGFMGPLLQHGEL